MLTWHASHTLSPPSPTTRRWTLTATRSAWPPSSCSSPCVHTTPRAAAARAQRTPQRLHAAPDARAHPRIPRRRPSRRRWRRAARPCSPCARSGCPRRRRAPRRSTSQRRARGVRRAVRARTPKLLRLTSRRFIRAVCAPRPGGEAAHGRRHPVLEHEPDGGGGRGVNARQLPRHPRRKVDGHEMAAHDRVQGGVRARAQHVRGPQTHLRAGAWRGAAWRSAPKTRRLDARAPARFARASGRRRTSAFRTRPTCWARTASTACACAAAACRRRGAASARAPAPCVAAAERSWRAAGVSCYLPNTYADRCNAVR